MKYFALWEIWRSVLSALVYGGIFALLRIICSVSICFIGCIAAIPRASVCYKGRILSPPVDILSVSGGDSYATVRLIFLKSIGILSFGIGFVLVSYYALDGYLRIYMLAISLVSSFAVYRLLKITLVRFLSFVYARLVVLIVYLLRFTSYLPKRFLMSFCFKFVMPLITKVRGVKEKIKIKKRI